MAFYVWERAASMALNRFPRFKQFAKKTYQEINYKLLKGNSFKFEPSQGCVLLSPEEICGIDTLPGEHFFGYYDKTPWSSSGRYFLLHNLQTRDRKVPVKLLALDSKEHRICQIGESKAWNFQQGSMLQWLSSENESLVIFNDYQGDDLVARIVDLTGKETERLPFPIQALHQGKGIAASINYNNLLRNRIDYAYASPAKNQMLAAENDGLILMDVKDPKPNLRISLLWFMEYSPRSDMARANHWLNHVMFSPAGDYLIVMHRWGTGKWRKSRLFSLSVKGGDPILLLDSEMVSHYHWLDENRIIAYCRAEFGDGYYIIDANTGASKLVDNADLRMLGDGHPSVSRKLKMVVTDTYPDRRGKQRLYIFDDEKSNEPLKKVISVSHPPSFYGTHRCDLHPRWHPFEAKISFDSVLSDKRRCWILDCQKSFDFLG